MLQHRFLLQPIHRIIWFFDHVTWFLLNDKKIHSTSYSVRLCYLFACMSVYMPFNSDLFLNINNCGINVNALNYKMFLLMNCHSCFVNHLNYIVSLHNLICRQWNALIRVRTLTVSKLKQMLLVHVLMSIFSLYFNIRFWKKWGIMLWF